MFVGKQANKQTDKQTDKWPQLKQKPKTTTTINDRQKDAFDFDSTFSLFVCFICW